MHCLLPEWKNHFTHAARPRVCYINTLARLRGGEERGATDEEDIVASVSTRRRIIPNVICMTGLQKRAGRIFREVEMISLDCFLQHFCVYSHSCSFQQIKTQFEAPLPEAGLHFAQVVIDSEAHAHSPVKSLASHHYLLDGAISMTAAAVARWRLEKKNTQGGTAVISNNSNPDFIVSPSYERSRLQHCPASPLNWRLRLKKDLLSEGEGRLWGSVFLYFS